MRRTLCWTKLQYRANNEGRKDGFQFSDPRSFHEKAGECQVFSFIFSIFSFFFFVSSFSNCSH